MTQRVKQDNESEQIQKINIPDVKDRHWVFILFAD